MTIYMYIQYCINNINVIYICTYNVNIIYVYIEKNLREKYILKQFYTTNSLEVDRFVSSVVEK